MLFCVITVQRGLFHHPVTPPLSQPGLKYIFLLGGYMIQTMCNSIELKNVSQPPLTWEITAHLVPQRLTVLLQLLLYYQVKIRANYECSLIPFIFSRCFVEKCVFMLRKESNSSHFTDHSLCLQEHLWIARWEAPEEQSIKAISKPAGQPDGSTIPTKAQSFFMTTARLLLLLYLNYS